MTPVTNAGECIKPTQPPISPVRIRANCHEYDRCGSRYVQSDPIGLAGGINTYFFFALLPFFSSCVTNPMGRLCGGGGVASRSAIESGAIPKS